MVDILPVLSATVVLTPFTSAVNWVILLVLLDSAFEFSAMLADKLLLVCVNADCSTFVFNFASVSDLV